MKAIIFDLFETLVTEWGRPKYTTRDIASDLDVDYKAFRREWEALHMDRYMGKLSGTLQVYEKILALLGIKRDEKLLLKISQKRDACKKACFENIDTRIINMLSELKADNFKLGLISNCSNEEIGGLKESAIYKYLDAVVLSCHAGAVKPNIKIYEHCLTLLSQYPSDCFYVGDGGSDELNGANRAGMAPLRALWFIKHLAKDYEKDYPAFYEPSDMVSFIKNHQ